MATIEAMIKEKNALPKFRQGREWDMQRLGGRYHDAYVDYSTVAIGLYAAAAGIPEAEILGVQNVYKIGSGFTREDNHDPIYRNLLVYNVKNTDIGYQMYSSGLFKSDDSK